MTSQTNNSDHKHYWKLKDEFGEKVIFRVYKCECGEEKRTYFMEYLDDEVEI